MSSFEDRKKNFENKFAHDEELKFKVNSKRNKYLGDWAAEILGKKDQEKEQYILEVIKSDFSEPGDEDIIKKLYQDLKDKNISENDVREKLNELNKKWDENEFSRYWRNHGIEGITARTGIHTGSVIAGNIGSDRMLQYSTIGDTVNVASRLEQRNKEFSTDILFSHEIYSSLTKDLYDLSLIHI